MDSSVSRRKERSAFAADLIHRSLCPRIAILSSPDVETVLEPNGFADLSECLRPFEDSLKEVTVRTSQLENKQCPTFPVRFDSIKAFANRGRPSIDLVDVDESSRGDYHLRNERPEEVLDMINAHITANSKSWESKVAELQVSDEEDAAKVNQATPEQLTPWFITGRDMILQSRSISRHETFGHPVALLLAVSTSSPDPMNAFASLYAATQAQNCDVFTRRPYVDPNVLRYYVLIHDQRQGQDLEEAKVLLDSIKRIYGLNCCILPINSGPPDPPPVADVTQLWTTSLQGNARAKVHSPRIDQEGDEKEYASLFSEEDVKRLKGFVRELVAQSLIPWMERCVAHWNESVSASRKGLTGRLFGAGKKLFGASSLSRSSSGTPDRPVWNSQGAYYPHGALEAQTRRLADFAFMTHDYKLAAAMYDIGRKDYASEKAFQYAAGANEMFGLSHLMIMMSSASPPIDVDSYLASACFLYRTRSMPGSSGVLLRPLRATLLYYEAYQALQYYKSAPLALVRAAEDPGADLEVMAAMLLEQAAIANLRAAVRPARRKWAFHLVMAGHRYQQCGAKMLSLRCFSGAQSVYKHQKPFAKHFLDEEEETEEATPEDGTADAFNAPSSDWTMVRTHVEHELGKQAFNDGNSEAAIEHFLRTITPQPPWTGPDPSATDSLRALHELYLSDLISAYKSLDAPQQKPADFPQPVFDVAHSQVRTGQGSSPGLQLDCDEAWGALEKRYLATGFAEGKAPPSLRSDKQRNFASAGETFYLDLHAVNPLAVPVTLTDIAVEVNEEGSEGPATGITIQDVPTWELSGEEKRTISIALSASTLGSYRVSRIHFKIADTIPVVQELSKHGKRLNKTREQRVSRKPMYAPDETLAIQIRDARPALKVDLTDAPAVLGLGEERDVVLTLRNEGKAAIAGVRMLAEQPDAAALAESTAAAAEMNSISVDNHLRDVQPAEVLAPSEPLKAGEVAQKTLRIRGSTLGDLAIRLLFVFEVAPGEFAGVPCSHRVEVHAVVDVAVEIKPAPSGFAYHLAMSALNLSPTPRPLRIKNITFVAPRWRIQSESLPGDLPDAQHTFSDLPCLQPMTAFIGVEEASTPQDPGMLLEYTSQQLAALLVGRDIDRSSRPPPATLQLSQAVTSAGSMPSPFLQAARHTWKRTILAQQYPAMSKEDRERVFASYLPEDLDILIEWETDEGQRHGQVFIFGLSLGPGHDRLSSVTQSVGQGGRSLYEETAKAKAALLESLARSPLAREEDPLVVDIEVGHLVDTNSAARNIPVTFRIRNMSTVRSASCVIELDSSVESDVNKVYHEQRQRDSITAAGASSLIGKASWMGRLTLRSAVIAPRQTIELVSQAQRPPRSPSEEAREYELADWSIKVTVETDSSEGEGSAESAPHFHSGRLRGGKTFLS